MKNNLDQFYTNPKIAEMLMKTIDISKFNLIIEPSAGNGSFSDLIPKYKCLAFDIDPKKEYIKKQDFLNFEYSGDITSDKIISLGNPPFGRNCSLAIKFIKKCFEFCDMVCFILPMSFRKESIKNKVPLNCHLIYEKKLPKNSFILNNEEYNVPCVFQVWQKKKTKRKPKKVISPIGFYYTEKNGNPDISVRRVGFYAGKSFLSIEKSEQSHYFIKFIDKNLDKNNVINEINKKKWEHNNTSGPRSISKPELNRVINKILIKIETDNMILEC